MIGWAISSSASLAATRPAFCVCCAWAARLLHLLETSLAGHTYVEQVRYSSLLFGDNLKSSIRKRTSWRMEIEGYLFRRQWLSGSGWQWTYRLRRMHFHSTPPQWASRDRLHATSACRQRVARKPAFRPEGWQVLRSVFLNPDLWTIWCSCQWHILSPLTVVQL